MRNVVNANAAVGFFLIAVGVFVIHQSFQIPVTRVAGWGPRAFPVLASIGVVLAGSLVLISGLKAGKASSSCSAPRGSAHPGAQHGAVVSVLGLIVLASGYVWLLDKIGYLLATALVTPAAFYLFGVRNPLALLIVTALCPLTYQIIFFELLRVYPPRGEWIDVVDLMRG